MRGQWLGSYQGNPQGAVTVELDDLGDRYEGMVYVYPGNPGLPPIAGAVTTADKSDKFSLQVRTDAINMRNGILVPWDSVMHNYPGVAPDPVAPCRFCGPCRGADRDHRRADRTLRMKIFVDELSRWTFSPSPVRSFGTRAGSSGKGAPSRLGRPLGVYDRHVLGATRLRRPWHRAPRAQRRKCICRSASATAANAYLAPTSGMEFRLGGIGRFRDAHVLADFTITLVVTLASKVSRPFRGPNLWRRLFNHS
jgi:hypothetical protein